MNWRHFLKNLSNQTDAHLIVGLLRFEGLEYRKRCLLDNYHVIPLLQRTRRYIFALHVSVVCARQKGLFFGRCRCWFVHHVGLFWTTELVQIPISVAAFAHKQRRGDDGGDVRRFERLRKFEIRASLDEAVAGWRWVDIVKSVGYHWLEQKKRRRIGQRVYLVAFIVVASHFAFEQTGRVRGDVVLYPSLRWMRFQALNGCFGLLATNKCESCGVKSWQH